MRDDAINYHHLFGQLLTRNHNDYYDADTDEAATTTTTATATLGFLNYLNCKKESQKNWLSIFALSLMVIIINV